MQIKLYKTVSPVNMLNKALTDEKVIEGAFRESASILNPVFTSEIVSEYNYCYIPLFNRYYFITDITHVNNGLAKFDCKVDVLMSFATDIKNSLGKARNAINANGYYNKVEIGTEVRQTTEKLEFPLNPFDENGSFILVAINGTGVQ